MPHAQIVDCVNFMPPRIVRNDELAAAVAKDGSAIESDAFFAGVRERRFASPEFSSGELGIQASKRLLERHDVAPDSIDLIITACVLTDLLANGIGADVQRGIGARNANFLNVDTNCTSWSAALNVARAFIEAGIHKRILVVTVTNFVSRLGDYQKLKRSWTLGDGASATLLVAGKPSILASYEKTAGDLYGHMRLEPDVSPEGCYKRYWEGNGGALTVNFSQDLLDTIRETATKSVPDAVHGALSACGMTTADIDMLITHQPNRLFIDGWRKALNIPPARGHDTLEVYGNMFLGTIPVTLADAIERKLVGPGSVVTTATFANAGDHVTAMVLRL